MNVAVDRPMWAVLSSATVCETGCGRLVFPAVDRDSRRRVIVEMAGDDEAHWTWTYPEHTAGRCRDYRGLT